MKIIEQYLIIILASIFAIFIHEFSKALTSFLLGDRDIKAYRQLSFNPLRYIDPIGLIFMVIWQIGWAKPISTNSLYYKDKKTGTLLTYCVPIVTNIILAILFFNIKSFWSGFYLFGRFCLSFAIFNLIPIYPLCGEKILKCFLNPASSMKFSQIEPFIRILIIILIAMGPLQVLLKSIINLLYSII